MQLCGLVAPANAPHADTQKHSALILPSSPLPPPPSLRVTSPRREEGGERGREGWRVTRVDAFVNQLWQGFDVCDMVVILRVLV